MVHDRGQLIRKEARTYETEEQKKIVKSKVKKRNLKTQLTNSPQPPFSALEKKEGEKKRRYRKDVNEQPTPLNSDRTRNEWRERLRGMAFRDVEGIYNAQFREKGYMYVREG